jgi:hypothetical protein
MRHLLGLVFIVGVALVRAALATVALCCTDTLVLIV